MITTQTRSWTKKHNWTSPTGELGGDAQLVFVFGERHLVVEENLFQQVRQFYPEAYIMTGSTAGNILGSGISNDSVTISALHFQSTKIWYADTTITNAFDSEIIGKKLAEFLPTENLVHSFILSDGLTINGSKLVESVNTHLPNHVTVTGGLAGDGDHFEETVVGCNSKPAPKHVALVGFYGSSLKIGYASEGGWTASGDTFTITRSEGNVLFELNGEPALDVYKKLLGDQAAGLPGTGLLFPIELELPNEGRVIRTLLSVDESAKSITFAGDMPTGLIANIMRATEVDLIKSAGQAAAASVKMISPNPAQFALLVSCVGRKLFLKNRTHEEVLAAQDALGEQAAVHGFYSYGELCPGKNTGERCLMHNQTMTITTFAEV